MVWDAWDWRFEIRSLVVGAHAGDVCILCELGRGHHEDGAHAVVLDGHHGYVLFTKVHIQCVDLLTGTPNLILMAPGKSSVVPVRTRRRWNV